MSEFSSYYLYQRYERRGSQDWIPCYPNVYSISGDSSYPMTLVMKSSADTACGYIPKGSDDYNYEKWEVVDGYICDDTTKYARERKYVSDDNVNWTATDIYRRSTTVLAYNSTDCGYDPQWDDYNCSKWEVVSNDYICNEGNKYQKLRKYVRQCENCNSCSSSWSATNIYKQGDIIEYDSTDCGYVIGERMYRWVNLNPSSDYYCDECPIYPTLYRWYPSGTTCVGYDKYVKGIKQESNDGGVTWITIVPIVESATTLIEADSEDCGYVPPTPTFDGKFKANYNNGTTYSAACTSSSALTSGETRPNGYTYTAMTSAEIGSCITSIGRNAFSNCSGLTSVTIDSGVTSIGEQAFWNCTGLTSIVLPTSVTTIGTDAFGGCWSLTSIVIPSGVTSIGTSVFIGCTSLTSVGLIGSGASVQLPNNLTSVGEWAFSNCSGLRNVILPNSLLNIGMYTFYYCTRLSSITIPSGVTSIGARAFERCRSLTSITIPSGVTSINYKAFYDCSGLTNITVNATTPPTLGSDVFNNTSANLVIYVPAASVNAYKSASGWSTYASRIQAIT